MGKNYNTSCLHKKFWHGSNASLPKCIKCSLYVVLGITKNVRDGSICNSDDFLEILRSASFQQEVLVSLDRIFLFELSVTLILTAFAILLLFST